MYTSDLNFDEDFNNILIAELAEKDLHIDCSENSDTIKIKYFNFKRRLISETPRTVLYSKEFIYADDYELGLKLIQSKFENGESLTPHLSKQLFNLDYNDPLLNDWKIYHLHLGTELEVNGSGFVNRTGPLLFVRIDEEKAYFINIMPHSNSWTKQEMVKIIHENWPESIEDYRMNGVIGLEHIPSDEDIKQMRKFGINTSVEIENGVVYMPIGGGLTSAKTSVEVTESLIRYNRLLRDLEQHVQNNLKKIGDVVSKNPKYKSSDLKIKLIITKGIYYAVEQQTGLAFRLGEH